MRKESPNFSRINRTPATNSETRLTSGALRTRADASFRGCLTALALSRSRSSTRAMGVARHVAAGKRLSRHKRSPSRFAGLSHSFHAALACPATPRSTHLARRPTNAGQPAARWTVWLGDRRTGRLPSRLRQASAVGYQHGRRAPCGSRSHARASRMPSIGKGAGASPSSTRWPGPGRGSCCG